MCIENIARHLTTNSDVKKTFSTFSRTKMVILLPFCLTQFPYVAPILNVKIIVDSPTMAPLPTAATATAVVDQSGGGGGCQ